MPYLTVVIPNIPQVDKDDFLAAWPTIANSIKALPMVIGLSAGPIVAEDGVAAKDFKFLQTISFNSLEDENAFRESDFVKDNIKKYKEKGIEPPKYATFEVPNFPADDKSPAFTQISQITVHDESKGEEVEKAWDDLAAMLSKLAWGGRSVEDGSKSGIGMFGWDSLEQAEAAYANPAVKAAIDHYHSFGEYEDAMIKLGVY